ncbi:MAG TPA: squalene--hopene cyclase, partial [Bradyrhizobium sp.]
KIGVYLRRHQASHGGWPLYHDGAFDLSATVKVYFALKMIGDAADAPHMVRAREAILARGGADRTNVFTRIQLALYGETAWSNTPTVPAELILLPRWFPIHLSKMSYWARTVIVPLLVLQALKPHARNPRNVHVPELFLPRGIPAPKRAPHQSRGWAAFFGVLDWLLKRFDPFWPKKLRKLAIKACVAFVTERLNGEDGLGAIYPAMANSVMMFDCLDNLPEHPHRAIARRAVEKLLVVKDDEAYCQPCVSPVWDTALVCHALMEAQSTEDAVARGLEWLKPLQVLDVKGDWAEERPDVRPGGWAFQYNNAHYPDLDDTAVVVMSMDRMRRASATRDYDTAIARGREWIEGMQCRNGGWAAFDVDNLEYYLNNIPFSDHGALLDPPTEDVTARCVSMLAQLGETPANNRHVAVAIEYLRRTQHPEGSWYGRWGMNFIYGTWSVLSALNVAGVDHRDPMIRRAVDWLVAVQNQDGGWGEDSVSYRLDYRGLERAPTTASQTAWALLGLMAAGEVENPAVKRGVECLIATQSEKGLWDEHRYTATGFPRVFYLRYHGYPKYFPLWALARYRNLKNTNSKVAGVGM